MGVHDLFGVEYGDPVTDAARMLAQHDLFVVPGSVMRECLNVLHILSCDAESTEEAIEIGRLIHTIEGAWEQGTGLKVGAHDTAARCVCGEPDTDGVHRVDAPCYVGELPNAEVRGAPPHEQEQKR